VNAGHRDPLETGTGAVASRRSAPQGCQLRQCAGLTFLIAGQLGDGFLGAIVIDQSFAGRRGGDQRRAGSIIESARQPQASFVQPGDRVVGELSRVLDYAEQSAPLLLGRVRLSW